MAASLSSFLVVLALVPWPQDAALGVTMRIGTPPRDARSGAQVTYVTISADGRFVCFEGAVAPGKLGGTGEHSEMDLRPFIHDRETGETRMIPVPRTPELATYQLKKPRLAWDGITVAGFLHPMNGQGADDCYGVAVVDWRTGRGSLVARPSDFTGELIPGSLQVSHDGRRIIVHSATDLTQGVDFGPGATLIDRDAGTIEVIEMDDSYGPVLWPHFSRDGGFIAFRAFDKLAGNEDVFVRDLTTDETSLVSVNSLGVRGNGHDHWAALSAGGRHVLMTSSSSNLVDDDTNESSDVFVHDRETGTTERVSVSSDGDQGKRHSQGGAISPDGRFVAFQSLSENLVNGDHNYSWDIFVHDRVTRRTRRVSVATDGSEGNANSKGFDMSDDGTVIVFSSLAWNFAPIDRPGTRDVFIHELPERWWEEGDE